MPCLSFIKHISIHTTAFSTPLTLHRTQPLCVEHTFNSAVVTMTYDITLPFRYRRNSDRNCAHIRHDVFTQPLNTKDSGHAHVKHFFDATTVTDSRDCYIVMRATKTAAISGIWRIGERIRCRWALCSLCVPLTYRVIQNSLP